MNGNITKNFTWNEMFRSDIAKEHNINNTENNVFVLFNIRNLVENILQPIRDEFGSIRVLSGYRCPELNEKVNGSVTSNHIYGTTADIESNEDVPLIDIMEFIDTKLTYKEMIAEYLPYGWIHICYDIYSCKRILKLKTKTDNYKKITIEELKKLYK